jgi:hypothetical protein
LCIRKEEGNQRVEDREDLTKRPESNLDRQDVEKEGKQLKLTKVKKMMTKKETTMIVVMIKNRDIIWILTD